MKKPISPCLDCEVRSFTCHEFCGLYKQYTELQAEWRRMIKQKRNEALQRVDWSDSRYKQQNRK